MASLFIFFLSSCGDTKIRVKGWFYLHILIVGSWRK
jgi:hypothetical protein